MKIAIEKYINSVQIAITPIRIQIIFDNTVIYTNKIAKYVLENVRHFKIERFWSLLCFIKNK